MWGSSELFFPTALSLFWRGCKTKVVEYSWIHHWGFSCIVPQEGCHRNAIVLTFERQTSQWFGWDLGKSRKLGLQSKYTGRGEENNIVWAAPVAFGVKETLKKRHERASAQALGSGFFCYGPNNTKMLCFWPKWEDWHSESYCGSVSMY